jgi:Na+/H+ antiporter NhaD/arsenite permease-like protein
MHGSHDATPLEQFLQMMFLPDNIPIVGMMVLIFWFTYLGFREARKNDELIRQGREDEILREMQE